jgi:hypothetical protein
MTEDKERADKMTRLVEEAYKLTNIPLGHWWLLETNPDTDPKKQFKSIVLEFKKEYLVWEKNPPYDMSDIVRTMMYYKLVYDYRIRFKNPF